MTALDWTLILRLLIAALLGSIVGIERERKAWAPGLRTHMLVCVGACLFMIVSAFGFGDVLGARNIILDPSRIAAQVVSGIGFLGAGAILLRGEVVRGLTTAASLWSVAAIGLAVGGGLYAEAMAATVVIIVILAGIKPLEERFQQRHKQHEIVLDTPAGALTLPGAGGCAGLSCAAHRPLCGPAQRERRPGQPDPGPPQPQGIRRNRGPAAGPARHPQGGHAGRLINIQQKQSQ